jgi:hypothetical protein
MPSRLSALDDLAPSEISADLHLFTGAEYTLLDPGDPKGLPEAAPNQPTGPVATAHVQQYLQQECGIS